jgi:hypothetical protein
VEDFKNYGVMDKINGVSFLVINFKSILVRQQENKVGSTSNHSIKNMFGLLYQCELDSGPILTMVNTDWIDV